MNWLNALPESLRADPDVIVVLAPDDATWQVTQSVDENVTFGLMKLPHTDRVLGLQVLHPNVGDYDSHVRVMRSAGFDAAPVAYVGLMSDIPQSVLMHDAMCPLIFLRDQMNRQYWNIKAWFNKKHGDAPWN